MISCCLHLNHDQDGTSQCALIVDMLFFVVVVVVYAVLRRCLARFAIVWAHINNFFSCVVWIILGRRVSITLISTLKTLLINKKSRFNLHAGLCLDQSGVTLKIMTNLRDTRSQLTTICATKDPLSSWFATSYETIWPGFFVSLVGISDRSVPRELREQKSHFINKITKTTTMTGLAQINDRLESKFIYLGEKPNRNSARATSLTFQLKQKKKKYKTL